MEEKTVRMSGAALPPRLFVLSRTEVFDLPLQGEQSLGRRSEENLPDIPLASRAVSRRHGLFVSSPDGCAYRDLNSTNGTLLNGEPLRPGVPYPLADGDVLRIHGRSDRDCVLDAVLVYATRYLPNLRWESLPLADCSEVAVGREQAISAGTPALSRRHASFFRAEQGWAILDHGSLNGVYRNNRRLERPEYLAPMDAVRMAGALFLYTGDRLLYQTGGTPADTPAETRTAGDGLSIWIEERSVWRRAKKKTLLRDIDLQIPAGTMTLVLGGSGAGKTTFFNAVMGYEPAEGRITYNGTDIYEEYERMKYEIGYVPQQDLLRLNDTVEATLRNAARMRLPAGAAPEWYDERVRETMALLGLSRERDSLVRQLSGGQRKRLSIAVEYIGGPSLFFLDEPDSGLDGTMARALLENLRAIADQGKLVLVISHAPDRAFSLFDRVIVLAKSDRENAGRLAFYGTPGEALAFFGVETLEQIVKRINRPDEGGEGLADHYIEAFERGGHV